MLGLEWVCYEVVLTVLSSLSLGRVEWLSRKSLGNFLYKALLFWSAKKGWEKGTKLSCLLED